MKERAGYQNTLRNMGYVFLGTNLGAKRFKEKAPKLDTNTLLLTLEKKKKKPAEKCSGKRTMLFGFLINPLPL